MLNIRLCGSTGGAGVGHRSVTRLVLLSATVGVVERQLLTPSE
jgi:hypothetical protein